MAEVLTVSAKIYPDVEFIEDETLGRGDCMMESRYGLVDGRIATKLAAIEESMGGEETHEGSAYR